MAIKLTSRSLDDLFLLLDGTPKRPSVNQIEMDGFIIFVVMLWLPVISYVQAESCSRRDSRLAFEIIQEVFIPIFDDTAMSVPPSCPLNPSRNIYGDNEKHKLFEDTSRWSCQYCGKAFFNQDFLDFHFENRHHETIYQPPNGLCLSDFCDILRCEVLDVRYTAKDHCNQTQISILKLKCQKTMKLCVPESLSGMNKYSFINDMRLALCGFLTCDRYDEKPIQETSSLMMLFLVMIGISFFFSAAIVSLLIFTDVMVTETIDQEDDDDIKKREEKYVAIRIPGEDSELRQRHCQDYYDACDR